jgi:putative endonuclease
VTEQTPSPNKRRIGREAEDRAAAHLLNKGYTLITRRYKGRRGEIDLICLDGEQLVFVEVKAWNAPGYSPEEAIGLEKALALRRAADEYLAKVSGDREHRFDLIAIDRKGLRHHVNFLAD